VKHEITSETVKEYGLDAGASIVGVASCNAFGSAPEGFRPTDVLPECLSVVVLGVTFSPEVFGDVTEYTASRNAMLTAVTNIAKEVAKRMKADGCKTKVVSAAGGKWVDVGDGKKQQFGFISLKHAAELAGLGVITRNYLLTSPEYGNFLWLSAVLTDAELTPDGKLQVDICGNCNKCVESCPVGALDDSASFGRKKCDKVFVIENKKFLIKCFNCRTVCPWRFGKSFESENK
jgi:epoxyqueuosine reductase QueG